MFSRPLRTGVLITAMGFTLLLPVMPLWAAEEGGDPNQRIPVEEVQRFSNALTQIKKYYVKPVDDKVLFENAIRGMLSGLDPHSSYLDEEDFKDLYATTSGEFGGLGIEVTTDDGVIKVVTPLIDSPAFKAGLKTNDYIVKIGNQSVQGMSLKDAVNLMRGKEGTSVELTVIRKGEKKPLMFTVVREKIQIKSVKSKLLENKFGYVRLTQFQAHTDSEMNKAITSLKEQAGGKLNGLILDLRNNPGGLLDSAIEISDAFLDATKTKPELIVYTEGRIPGSKFSATAKTGDIIDKAPMVVLINNGSASAAEIVAGALKDNKRALILGTRSFGKGSVQTVLPLDDKRGIKLTTALYYTPSGTSIQAKGITPDIVIEELSMPKGDKDNVFGFSESDLNGHLPNGNKGAAVAAKPTVNASASSSGNDEDSLLHNDYQLYAALTILKGLVIAQH